MWTITKTFRFEAAHRLPHHEGKCKRLHGHSFVGRVILGCDTLITEGPSQGMVYDFDHVKDVVGPLLESHLDHHFLNETLQMESPTSEHVAAWLFEKLVPHFGPLLVAVEIDETCTCSARYAR